MIDFESDKDVEDQIVDSMADKSEDFRRGYSEGTLDSSKGFYLALKEIRDNYPDKEEALSMIAEMAIALGFILYSAGRLSEDEI